MMLLLHTFLNSVLFGSNSDLAWAFIRAVTTICGVIAAVAVARTMFRWLYRAIGFLSFWIFLKVLDDVFFRNPASKLTVYFLVSNLVWAAVLIGIAWGANHRRHSSSFGGRVGA